MKIALHLPVWQRLELTRAMYHGLERNTIEFGVLGYELEVHVGYSEPEHKALAEEFGWIAHEVTNETLGLKNQALFEAMKAYEWDWLMQLGSDDFLLRGGAECIVNEMQVSEFSAFNCLFFFNAETRKGWHLRGYRCGAGRFMSRRICDRVNTMWNERRKGLDGWSANRVKEVTGVSVKTMKGTYIADVKTDVNVTPYFVDGSDDLSMDAIIPEAHLI